MTRLAIQQLLLVFLFCAGGASISKAQECYTQPVIINAFQHSEWPFFPVAASTSEPGFSLPPELANMDTLFSIETRILAPQGIAANRKKSQLVQSLSDEDIARLAQERPRMCGIVLPFLLDEEHRPSHPISVELIQAKLARQTTKTFGILPQTQQILVGPDTPVSDSFQSESLQRPLVVATATLTPTVWEQAFSQARATSEANQRGANLKFFAEIYIPFNFPTAEAKESESSSFTHLRLRSLGPAGTSTAFAFANYQSFMVGASNENSYLGEYYEADEDGIVYKADKNANYDLVFAILGYPRFARLQQLD